MAPERVDGDQKTSYGVRADVWSVGITLVRLDFLIKLVNFCFIG